MTLNLSTRNKHKIIVANWKMNGSETLLKEFSTFAPTKTSDLIICPPFTLLNSAKALLPDFIKIGAQNCSEKDNGAFTGEISASMLLESNVSHVIIGHSERRTLYNENDTVILKKVESAILKDDKKLAQKALIEAQPEMHRSVTKGIFKKNTISRKLSRLSARIKKIA